MNEATIAVAVRMRGTLRAAVMLRAAVILRWLHLIGLERAQAIAHRAVEGIRIEVRVGHGRWEDSGARVGVGPLGDEA